MNTAALWRLTWKEYRANRALWIAVVVLVVVSQAAAALFLHSTSHSATPETNLIYLLALGGPIFFAAGSAGMAFAIEREEGTIDFLRAAPVSPKFVVASKMGVATLATIALIVALWPMALWFSRGQMPTADAHGSFVIGLLLAFEAIAWGTLFSLFSTRPLLAICQTIFVVSMIVEVPALAHASIGWGIAAFSTGLAALAADIYLGLRWLDQDRTRTLAGPSVSGRVRRWMRRRSAAREWAGKPIILELSQNRDRSTMLGHLLWQHWRQSAWVMLALPAMWVAVFVALGQQFVWRWEYPATAYLEWIIIGGAALIGCAVFRADQARRNYRYFVEHKIPARYVWFTRQVFWCAAMCVAVAVVWIILTGPEKLVEYIHYVSENPRRDAPWGDARDLSLWRYELPWATSFVVIAIVAYSAGQWASMIVRSGILSAVVAAAIAIPLCGWVDLMHQMQISPWWSVLPIPLVLIFATWLRAPDWVLENRRWSARLRAAAVVLLPAIGLCVAVPIYRVRQLPPRVSPGFDYQALFPTNPTGANSSTKLIQRASDLFVSRGKLSEDKWLAENEGPLAMAIDASRGPKIEFNDPRTSDEPVPPRSGELLDLMLGSAAAFQRQGKLDEEFDRLLATLRLTCHLGRTDIIWDGRQPYDDRIFDRCVDWAAEIGQSAKRIDAAIKRLAAIDIGDLRLEEQIEWKYAYARHKLLDGDGVLFPNPDGSSSERNAADVRWLTLMPWERERAVRMLNLLTATAFERLQLIKLDISHSMPIYYFVTDSWSEFDVNNFLVRVRPRWWWGDVDEAQRQVDLLRTTRPTDLPQIGYFGFRAAWAMTKFETNRRAALIRMALIAWKLKNKDLPNSLSQLVGPNFDAARLDPYSAEPFEYFSNGMPTGNVSNIAAENDSSLAKIVPGQPGIWSMGPKLEPNEIRRADKKILTYGSRGWLGDDEKRATTWQLGLWFPLPEQKK